MNTNALVDFLDMGRKIVLLLLETGMRRLSDFKPTIILPNNALVNAIFLSHQQLLEIKKIERKECDDTASTTPLSEQFLTMERVRSNKTHPVFSSLNACKIKMVKIFNTNSRITSKLSLYL